MHIGIRITFLFITIVQGLHSIEEYLGKLWDVYPPAAFVCSLVSSDLEKGFVIINVSLFIVLVLIWLATFSKNPSIKGFLWFWAIMELINGMGHSIWAITQSSYTPGLLTAPILIFLAVLLIGLLIKQKNDR